jgi:hypothetical protein
MGSSSSKDVVEEGRQQKLDVSHQLSPLQYKKVWISWFVY